MTGSRRRITPTVGLLLPLVVLVSGSALAQQPAEVPDLAWCPSGRECLEWSPVAGASGYHVERGEERDLPCLLDAGLDSCQRAVAATSTDATILESPPSGRFFWYLVTAWSPGGEGSAGNASTGVRQPNGTSSCSTTCSMSGRPCSNDSNCCSGSCQGGVCRPMCCTVAGETCDGDTSSCCSGVCGLDDTCGACIPVAPGATSCLRDDQCCNGHCDTSSHTCCWPDGHASESNCLGCCGSCFLNTCGYVCTPNGQGCAHHDTCCSGQCDSLNRSCGHSNGAGCSSPSECSSGHCSEDGCCDTDCTGLCRSCAGGIGVTCHYIPAGQDPDDECPGPGATCNGTGGCAAPSANGASCSSALTCLSGNCVDGVCCDTACVGGCRACSAAKKGGGANGTCGSIANGLDPDNECAGSATCDGTGICTSANPNGTPCSSTVQCLSGWCVDGVCCDSACTSGCWACTVEKRGSGLDGNCGRIEPGLDPDNECPGSAACNGSGSCSTVQPNGTTCTSAAQCQSGYCVDGLCCIDACTGVCRACNLPSAPGMCANIPAGQDPANECGGVCTGTGACSLLPNGSPCNVPAECVSGNCLNGFCHI